MSTKPDGGPAFPIWQEDMGLGDTAGPGMSLRDYFAAHATADFTVVGPLTDADIGEIAAECARVRYAVADAMLEERIR